MALLREEQEDGKAIRLTVSDVPVYGHSHAAPVIGTAIQCLVQAVLSALAEWPTGPQAPASVQVPLQLHVVNDSVAYGHYFANSLAMQLVINSATKSFLFDKQTVKGLEFHSGPFVAAR